MRFLYDEALTFVRRSPQDACLAFAGVPPLKRPPTTATLSLDQAREALGRFWSDMGRPMDGEFLRWYAHEREAAEDKEVTAAAAYKRAAQKAFYANAPLVVAGQDRGSRFVPSLLGILEVDLGTTRAPRFVLGLRRGVGRTRWALSGAEWVVALSALALGCLRAAPDEVPLLAPADVGMDEELLREWMECLSGAPAQVLLTSTLPSLRAIAGFPLVHV